MVKIDMTTEEKGILLDVLENYISDLRMEIADTDKSDFKEKLRTKKDVLNTILSKLQKSD